MQLHVFVVPLAWSAIQYLTEAPKMVETMTVRLGYPMYFLAIVGVANLIEANPLT